MTDFATPAEWLDDLRQRLAEYDDQIEVHEGVIAVHRDEINHRMGITAGLQAARQQVAVRVDTIERVMAMQPPSGITLAQLAGEEPFVVPPVLRDWCEEHNRGSLPNGLCPECEARHQQRSITVPQPPVPRQRQDVRGPVLALIRDSFPDEWTIEAVARELPALKAPSIRAALQSLAQQGEIRTNGSGLYWAWAHEQAPVAAPDAAPASAVATPLDDRQGGDSGRHSDAALAAETPTAAANPDDRHSEDGGRHPPEDEVVIAWSEPTTTTYPGALASGVAAAALAKSVQETEDRRVPRHTAEPEPAWHDERVVTDASPEGQAHALRAAVKNAGPAGLPEDDAWIDPVIIMAAVEEGWLDRTEDDRGVRLWLREGAGK